MKYIKTFKKLFEAEQIPGGYQWDSKHIMQVFEIPEIAEFPFVEIIDQESADYNSITFKNLMAASSSQIRELSKLHFVNLMKYIIRMDNNGFANWCLGNFIKVFEIGSRVDFLRLTIIFEDRFFDMSGMREITMEIKRSEGIVGPDETEEDLRNEVREIEAGDSYKEETLTGKNLENAIDNALDRRDFDEVARLSKMMKESESYDVLEGDDIETIFDEYLEIFKNI
jgi:hypothetical protein